MKAIPPTLPDPEQDKVLLLQNHYFQAAELFYANAERLQMLRERYGKLKSERNDEWGLYVRHWLASLFVVAEGFTEEMKALKEITTQRRHHFQHLIPKIEALIKQCKEHYDSMKLFRNFVYHYQKSSELISRKALQFIDHEKLSWAKTLHLAFREFFREYEAICRLIYWAEDRPYGKLKRTYTPVKRKAKQQRQPEQSRS